MTFDRQFVDAMTELVTVQHLLSSSSGGYGGRNYATSSGGQFIVTARLEQQLRVIRKRDGSEIASNLVMYCPPYDSSTDQNPITIQATDLLTFPSGYQTSPISEAERHNDEQGLMYFAVNL